MNLIYVNDHTIHNMDNGITYINGGDEIHLLGSHQDYIAYGEDAKIFWTRLQSQTMVPQQRTNPQPAPVETPILVDLKPSPVEDEFTPPVERKFKDGDEPYVTNGKRSRFGERIVVVGYTLDDYVLDVAGNTYRESELEPAD